MAVTMDVSRDSGMAITVDVNGQGRPGSRAELVLPLSTVLRCLGTESGPRDSQQQGGQGEEPEAGEGSGGPCHPCPSFLTLLLPHCHCPHQAPGPTDRSCWETTGTAHRLGSSAGHVSGAMDTHSFKS